MIIDADMAPTDTPRAPGETVGTPCATGKSTTEGVPLRPATGRRRAARLLVTLAVIAAALGTLTASPTPASAIDQDRGWTHLYNNNWPVESHSPECQPHLGGQNCSAWSVAPGRQYPSIPYVVNASVQGLNVAEAVKRMVNDVPCGHCPWFFPGSLDGANGVWFVAKDHREGVCGSTHHYGDPWQPPTNFGCCQQGVFWGADVYVDMRPVKDHCNRFNVLLHETGHVVGLGHTGFNDQMMFPSGNNRISSRNLGDSNGQFCIYQMQQCG